jgi:Leucine-rich repeat (LRR) protein
MLRFLDLSDNAIDLVEPDTFSGMKNLLLLDLSNNQLHALSDVPYQRLEEFSLSELAGQSTADYQQTV